ncbi:hypothetical protein Tco_1211987 [Tanacetum coccineum]
MGNFKRLIHLKRQMSEKDDRYHDTVLDLEAKLKKNVDLILKLGNSLQGMFMLGPKPLFVYDQQLKHGLGYPNPYTLKEAISQCPKLYLASSLGNSEISLNVRDTEDTLDDASKNFVPQKEFSAKQKYFPSSFIPSDKNSNATPSIPASMPSESPLIIELDKINICFQRLTELIQKNCKRASIFYTSLEEIQLNDFFQDQLKPIVNELQFYFEFFKTLFKGDIKEMKDVFESTESELCKLEKQNDFLKDQLLEVSLKHEVELSVLLNHECVDNSLHAEIEQLKKKSIEIQEGLQARIKILEKDVQRCEKQSVDFELKLQHEKEKHKWDSSFKNKNTNPLDYSWISKMEKLEDENVSLDFTVQSLIKERDNVKLEYQKLFNSIKKTRSQTQTEMDELIAHVSEKTYAYGAIRAENQNLLFTISELKTRLANVEKGKSVNTKFDKTNGSQPLLCVTPLHKHVIQKKTDVQKSEENHVVSKPVTLQTSPAKQRGVNSNKNVIAPGMYKVVTTHESQTNEAKHDLSSTGMNAASSVRRPMNRDSHVKNSVLANSKKPAKKVAVYVRKNKQTDITSENVISNKENVIDVDVANASKAKTLLCVSCMQNVLIPCHDNCFANYKLNVHSNVRRTLSTKSRTPKSYDTTYVVHKTRFSKKSTLSKSLDTTYVVSKPKIDVGSTSKANDKVVQIVLWIVDSGCSKHMMGDQSLLKNFIEKFMGTVRFGNDYIYGNITICHVYYVEGLGHNLFSVGQFCDGDLEVAFRSKTCYVRNLEGDDLLTGDHESNLYTISIFWSWSFFTHLSNVLRHLQPKYGDSAVTFYFCSSEDVSWCIPSEDPYEEVGWMFVGVAKPRSPEGAVEMRDIASAFYHSLHPSGTPPLLPIPLPAPSTSRRADIPEADTPPRKRLLLTTPRPGCEIGESSAAAAARQPGPTMAHRVDHSHVDTMETRFRDIERRMMTALEMVNMRVSYQVDVRSRESSEFYSRHHDAQKDRAAVRAEIEVLRRERLAYEQESIQTRQDLARSEAHCRALEARVTVLETEVRRHEWQRQAADDLAVQHIMRTQALEAGARVDTLEDTENGTKENHKVNTVTPTPNATPTTTVTEAQLQALIDQGVAAAMAEAEASRVRNGYNSNGSGPRPAQTARECSYSEFLKCKPLDFKGTEGVVGLTRWFEKMESVFSISNCTAASQVKFATCTLQDDALTWWNAHVKTTTPEAAHAMPWATPKKMMTDKYCPRGEIKKIESEMMFPEEIDKIEKYIGGLPDMIHGSVKASKPKTMQEAIEFTTELMDEKTHAYAERQAEWKRKYDDLSKNNQNQQNKRQNTGQAYTAGNSGRKSYAGSKPLCSKCNYNHEGPCVHTSVHDNCKVLAI